ncbi:DUF7553 family protein [Halomarina oriensis]|uniref:Uncharacterized protein n=1 Tax=Halomarina oriensis TaxID=671145 RepID=A0A6B0GN62_9EURY|nr:hypothetical protein [Halomarina oriensis]MWG33008.1 hypothetical protein [Halomarina oriensis]
MSRTALTDAAAELETAASHADGERRERIEGQAEALTTLADRERGPDQGRLDRHMNVLRELAGSDDEATPHVEAALEHVTEYRSTVGGI